jgi:hypothetical protein
MQPPQEVRMPEEKSQPAARAAAALPEHVSQNITDIVDLQEREIRAVGRAQRWLDEDRVDPHVSALKEQADPAQVMAALKERHRARKRRSE